MMNILRSEVSIDRFRLFKSIFVVFMKREGYSEEFAAEEFSFLVALSSEKSVAEFEKAYAFADRRGRLAIPGGRAARIYIALSFENALNHACFDL